MRSARSVPTWVRLILPKEHSAKEIRACRDFRAFPLSCSNSSRILSSSWPSKNIDLITPPRALQSGSGSLPPSFVSAVVHTVSGRSTRVWLASDAGGGVDFATAATVAWTQGDHERDFTPKQCFPAWSFYTSSTSSCSCMCIFFIEIRFGRRVKTDPS